MFTGIIEEVGEVTQIQKRDKSSKLSIRASSILEDLKLGDSISTNGLCLTVSAFNHKEFTGDVMPESFKRSNLGELTVGSKVNLERAVALNGRFGGYIVSGHIDGTGKILSIKKEENAVWFVTSKSFSVLIIPHTIKETILSAKKVGDKVNLENDILGKYIEKLLTGKDSFTGSSLLTKDKIIDYGF